VFIKRVTVRNVARYLSKYLTRELLLSAPKGVGRITTARGIKLFPPFVSGIDWELLKESLWQRLGRFGVRRTAIEQEGVIRLNPERQSNLFRFTLIHLTFDEERFLKAFEVVMDG
jgi:hypothetical protein